MSEWQTIDTAPKDGTKIIVGWFEFPGQDQMHLVRWHSIQKAWCDSYMCFGTAPHQQPTHWRPRPERP